MAVRGKERTVASTWCVAALGSTLPRDLRSASRGGSYASDRYNLFGFRVARTLSKTAALREEEKAAEVRQRQEERDRPKAKPIEQLPPELQTLDRQMVTVTGGLLMIGCTREQEGECDDNENPAHLVRVADFQISRYEVTRGEWAAVRARDGVFIGEFLLDV